MSTVKTVFTSKTVKIEDKVVANEIKEILSKKHLMTPLEYNIALMNTSVFKNRFANGNPPVCWLERINSEEVLTTNDVSVDMFKEYVHELSQYIDGNELIYAGKTICSDFYVDEHGDVYEPGITYIREESAKDIYNTPNVVYLQKVTIDNIGYWIKVGKTTQEFKKRQQQYSSLGKMTKSNYGSITEQLMKNLLRVGYEIEWYALKIPTLDSIEVAGSKLKRIYPISVEDIEQWFKDIIKAKFNKRFVENIKIK